MGLIVILVAATGFAATGKQKLRVKVAVGNIRSAPGKGIIKQVPQGTILDYRGVEGEWYKVDLLPDPKGVVVTGYIHPSLVDFVPGDGSAPKTVEPTEVIRKKTTAKPAKQTPTAEKAVPTPAAVAVEKKFTISILGGGGATFVNIPRDLEIKENWLMDWDKINWRVTVQGIYKIKPWLGIGGEFGFDTFYYAVWNSPSVSWSHFVTVTATNIHLLAELDFTDSFFFQAGVGMFFFSESAGIGFLGALGGSIAINKVFSIPVMIRFDAIPNAPMPLTLMVGLRMKVF